MKKYDQPNNVFHAINLAARAVLENAVSNEELDDSFLYRDFANRVYLAAHDASELAVFFDSVENANALSRSADALREHFCFDPA